MSDLMTVSELARAAGVTPQAVYKRLSTDLKPFVKVVDGKKRLFSKALELFTVNRSTTVDNPVDNPFKDVVDVLRAQMELLQHQLDVKDQQLKAQAEQIEQLHTLLSQQQQLHGAQLLAAGSPEPEEDPDNSPTQDLTGKTPPQRQQEEKPPRKSFLGRLFGKGGNRP